MDEIGFERPAGPPPQIPEELTAWSVLAAVCTLLDWPVSRLWLVAALLSLS